jgi:hypothetical protein
MRLGADGWRGEPRRGKRGVGDFYRLSQCRWSIERGKSAAIRWTGRCAKASVEQSVRIFLDFGRTLCSISATQ